MLVGVTPFRGETVNDLKKNILAGTYTMPEYVSTFAQHIINRMLEMDPARRMNVIDVKVGNKNKCTDTYSCHMSKNQLNKSYVLRKLIGFEKANSLNPIYNFLLIQMRRNWKRTILSEKCGTLCTTMGLTKK
jgi:hypothetical protein